MTRRACRRCGEGARRGQPTARNLHTISAHAGAKLSSGAGRRLGEREPAMAELKRGRRSLHSRQGNRRSIPLFLGLLADLEAAAGDYEGRFDGDRGSSWRSSPRTAGEHFTDAFFHHLRGDILLKRDPADHGPPRKPSSPPSPSRNIRGLAASSLRAALSLAKLYQSTGRARRQPAACSRRR